MSDTRRATASMPSARSPVIRQNLHFLITLEGFLEVIRYTFWLRKSTLSLLIRMRIARFENHMHGLSVKTSQSNTFWSASSSSPCFFSRYSLLLATSFGLFGHPSGRVSPRFYRLSVYENRNRKTQTEMAKSRSNENIAKLKSTNQRAIKCRFFIDMNQSNLHICVRLRGRAR